MKRTTVVAALCVTFAGCANLKDMMGSLGGGDSSQSASTSSQAASGSDASSSDRSSTAAAPKKVLTAAEIAAAAKVAPAASAKLPDSDMDDHFEGRAGGTFGKDVRKLLPITAAKKIAVAGFHVAFVVENTATAKVDSVYLPGGVERTGAHSQLTVKLTGVDYKAMQEITDKAYATFIQQIKLTGREVLSMDQIKPLFGKLKLEEASTEKPYEENSHQGRALVFSATGMPLWCWTAADAYCSPGFSQTNWRTVPQFSLDNDVLVISPEIVVSFAKMSSSGNHSGLVAREAAVGAQLAASVHFMHTHFVHATEVKYGGMQDGEEADFRLVKGFAVEKDFAEMQEVESSSTGKWTAILTGSSKSKKVENAVTDNNRYSTVALDVLAQSTGAMAKFIQTASKK